MPLRTLTRYRNPDVTSDLNHRLRDLVGRGVFSGGQVLPVAGTLTVSIENFAAMGSDGMVTVLEGAAETLAVTAGQTQWVALHAYYVANAPPVAELQVLTETAYDALSAVEQARRVRLARVTLASDATEVTAADISQVDTDRIDPVARSSFRGNVTTATALPDYTDPATGITTQNQPNDIYFVEDERVFYSWSTSGTPQWATVISAAEEIALASHKLNQDDGTVAPDFYNAQHVLLKHRESLDEGSASVKQHGVDGTDFGAGNAFVDEQYPETVQTRVDVTGLIAAVQFTLPGTYRVGTGGVGTANDHFVLVEYQERKALLGSDRQPITVAQVRRSDNSFELQPSTDADGLGYYTDPIVLMNFAATVDGAVSGNVSVYAGVKRTAGTVTTADSGIDTVGIGLIRPAKDIPVVGAGFSQIPTTTDDVQEALDSIDAAVSGLSTGANETLKKVVGLGSLAGGPDPDSLYWYGGTAAQLGQLTEDSGDPQVRALASTNLRFRTGSSVEDFIWQQGGTEIARLDDLDFIVTGPNPGLVLRDSTASAYDFRIGVDADVLQFSVDMDGDDTRDASGNFDDAPSVAAVHPTGMTIAGGLRIGLGGTPSSSEVLIDRQVGIFTSGVSPATSLEVNSGSIRLNVDNAATLITRTIEGVELVRQNFDIVTRWGNAIKWMSTDTSLDDPPASTLPKLLALIAPRNTEVYNDGSKGGTALDFGISPNVPGQDSVPTLSMTLDQSGRLFVGDVGSFNYGTPDSLLHCWAGTAGSVAADASSLVTVESDSDAFLTFLTPDIQASGIYFGSESDATDGYIRYDHNVPEMAFRVDNNRTLVLSAADAKIEGAASAELTILANSGSSQINLGDAADIDAGYIRYNHTSDYMEFAVAANTKEMRLDQQGLAIGGSLDAEVPLHVRIGSRAGSFAANTVAILENNDDAFLTFQTSAINTAGIYWSDDFDATVGGLTYNHVTNAMTFRTNDADRMTIDSVVSTATELRVGTTDALTIGSAQLTVLGGSARATFSDTAADDTDKIFRFTIPNYNSNDPGLQDGFCFLRAHTTLTANRVHIGGGSADDNAATQIVFYAASNNTTTTGTSRMSITSGNISAGPFGSSQWLALNGPSQANNTILGETLLVLDSQTTPVLTLSCLDTSAGVIAFANPNSNQFGDEMALFEFNHSTETFSWVWNTGTWMSLTNAGLLMSGGRDFLYSSARTVTILINQADGTSADTAAETSGIIETSSALELKTGSAWTTPIPLPNDGNASLTEFRFKYTLDSSGFTYTLYYRDYSGGSGAVGTPLLSASIPSGTGPGEVALTTALPELPHTVAAGRFYWLALNFVTANDVQFGPIQVTYTTTAVQPGYSS